jgi:hypothetical protein
VQATLRKKDQSAFQPPTNATWFFALDNSYDPDDADPVFTNNDNFNLAADWADLDVDNGKICWRIDCSTTQLASKFANATPAHPATLSDVKGELWMTPSGGSPCLICQWDITLHNIVSEIDADTTLVYSTTNLIQQDGDDTVVYFPDGTEAFRYSK